MQKENIMPADILGLILLGALLCTLFEAIFSPNNPWTWWFNIITAFTYYKMVVKPYDDRKTKGKKHQ
jgi:hypothetical protein